MSDNLSKYLLERGVNITSNDLDPKITEDTVLLGKVAGAWKTNKEEITAVIQARMNRIREDLILNCIPQETVVLRQVLVELAGIIDDFEKELILSPN